MILKIQKRLASGILGVSKKKIRFDPTKLEEIKGAITKTDIKGLINSKMITAKPIKGISRGRIRKRKAQKRKGKRKGLGSRKGKFSARTPKKTKWVNKMRLQRKFIKELKDKKLITTTDYHKLYKKAKSGFFRNKRHIKLYIKEHNLIKKK